MSGYRNYLIHDFTELSSKAYVIRNMKRLLVLKNIHFTYITKNRKKQSVCLCLRRNLFPIKQLTLCGLPRFNKLSRFVPLLVFQKPKTMLTKSTRIVAYTIMWIVFLRPKIQSWLQIQKESGKLFSPFSLWAWSSHFCLPTNVILSVSLASVHTPWRQYFFWIPLWERLTYSISVSNHVVLSASTGCCKDGRN